MRGDQDVLCVNYPQYSTPSTTVLTPLKHAAIGLHALVHSTMHTYLEFYIRA